MTAKSSPRLAARTASFDTFSLNIEFGGGFVTYPSLDAEVIGSGGDVTCYKYPLTNGISEIGKVALLEGNDPTKLIRADAFIGYLDHCGVKGIEPRGKFVNRDKPLRVVELLNSDLNGLDPRKLFSSVVSTALSLTKHHVYHIDIKKESLLVRGNDEVLLCDFGDALYLPPIERGWKKELKGSNFWGDNEVEIAVANVASKKMSLEISERINSLRKHVIGEKKKEHIQRSYKKLIHDLENEMVYQLGVLALQIFFPTCYSALSRGDKYNLGSEGGFVGRMLGNAKRRPSLERVVKEFTVE